MIEDENNFFYFNNENDEVDDKLANLQSEVKIDIYDEIKTSKNIFNTNIDENHEEVFKKYNCTKILDIKSNDDSNYFLEISVEALDLFYNKIKTSKLFLNYIYPTVKNEEKVNYIQNLFKPYFIKEEYSYVSQENGVYLHIINIKDEEYCFGLFDICGYELLNVKLQSRLSYLIQSLSEYTIIDIDSINKQPFEKITGEMIFREINDSNNNDLFDNEFKEKIEILSDIIVLSNSINFLNIDYSSLSNLISKDNTTNKRIIDEYNLSSLDISKECSINVKVFNKKQINIYSDFLTNIYNNEYISIFLQIYNIDIKGCHVFGIIQSKTDYNLRFYR